MVDRTEVFEILDSNFIDSDSTFFVLMSKPLRDLKFK